MLPVGGLTVHERSAVAVRPVKTSVSAATCIAVFSTGTLPANEAVPTGGMIVHDLSRVAVPPLAANVADAGVTVHDLSTVGTLPEKTP